MVRFFLFLAINICIQGELYSRHCVRHVVDVECTVQNPSWSPALIHGISRQPPAINSLGSMAASESHLTSGLTLPWTAYVLWWRAYGHSHWGQCETFWQVVLMPVLPFSFWVCWADTALIGLKRSCKEKHSRWAVLGIAPGYPFCAER